MTDTAPDTGTTDTTTADASTEATATSGTDLAAEVEKWKSLARKHEDKAKANAQAAKDLEQVRQASMSETEKAVAQARAEARAEAMADVGSRLVDAEVRVAAAGTGVDVDALLEGLDRRRFLTDEGEPDGSAIGAWVARIAPKQQQEERPPGFPDLGQGARGAGPNAALNGDPLLRDLKAALGMS